jgi:hypothetical protein
MTAFADFIDLQTAVVEMVKRPDIADVMPRLVKLAEADFNRRLRMADQMQLATVEIVEGMGNLPYDFQQLIGIYDGAGREYVAQPPQALRMIQNRGYFAIVGRKIHAAADEALTVQYYGGIPSIADDARSANWLLERHPGLYLYGVGMEAAKYIGNAEIGAVVGPLLAAEYLKAEGDDDNRRYARARVRVQGVTP